ncbi:MAG: FxsA family protein, partial [Gammaproteobacteria bacterium]
VAGAALARYQGMATLQRLQATLGRGETPAIEMLEGVILLAGALLLLTPGFFTDLVGFACLLPPSRRALALWGLRRMAVPPASRPVDPAGKRDARTIEGEFKREDDR